MALEFLEGMGQDALEDMAAEMAQAKHSVILRVAEIELERQRLKLETLGQDRNFHFCQGYIRALRDVLDYPKNIAEEVKNQLAEIADRRLAARTEDDRPTRFDPTA